MLFFQNILTNPRISQYSIPVASNICLDLLQVDLLASGASLFGCEAADRERRSRERSTCLAWWVSICISRQKWGLAWLAFGVSGFICASLTSMAECADSTPTKSIERVCLSPSSKEQICLLCAKVVSNNDFRRKLMTSGGRKKTKTCFNLESILGKEISQPRNPWHPHTF